MIQGRRILRPGDLTAVLFFVKAADPSVNAEVERLGKTLYIGRAMGALELVNADATGVCYGHDSSSLGEVLQLN
jgi:hypothetical protein